MAVKQKYIDISQFNIVTDWSKVKAAGYPVVIRIAYRGSKTGVITYDAKYKEYRLACERYGIAHSFYFFPCSVNDREAHEEALFIKKEVAGSGIKMPVWLDSEVVQRDRSGRSDTLTKEERTRYLRIICEDLLAFGIPCGIYASRSWFYNNIDISKIPADAVKNTWVAEYGVSMTKYTGYYAMWQYSSKESVNGIIGYVDMSDQYNDFHMLIDGKKTSTGPLTDSGKDTDTEPGKHVEKSELEKVIEVAKKEIGYLEKKSESQLDSKTANAGYKNYTKYWRDIRNWCGLNYQGQPYCAGFVTWVFTVALGQERAKELLKHYPYVYCPTLGNLFTKYSDPQAGDIVIFYRNGVFAHTGIVIAVNGDQFTTIEGNTSGASSIIDNGGGVCQKTYYNSKLPGTKFCRPAYTSTSISSDHNKVAVADDLHTVKWKGFVIGDADLTVRLQPTTLARHCSFSPLLKGTEVGVSAKDGDWYLIKYDGKFGYVPQKYISANKDDTVKEDPAVNTDKAESIGTAKNSPVKKETKPVADDIHTVKWNGIVNTKKDTLTVRMLPSLTGKPCSFSPLDKGTVVGVCHRDGDWYLIKYNGKYGYVYAPYIIKKQ